MLSSAGFRVARRDVQANGEVLSDEPGLREGDNIPVAVILDCLKDAGQASSWVERDTNGNRL